MFVCTYTYETSFILIRHTFVPNTSGVSEFTLVILITTTRTTTTTITKKINNFSIIITKVWKFT